MSKRRFSQEQVHEFQRNPHIKKCSEKSITFTYEFKIAAVRDWRNGLSPQEIFLNAGFDLHVIGREIPKGCLGRWRNVYQKKGEQGLIVETRGKGGGRPRKNWHNDQEKIKYLEAQVAYLKAENDFLIKLRKKS